MDLFNFPIPRRILNRELLASNYLSTLPFFFYLPGQEGSNRKIGDEMPLTFFFFKVKYKYEKNP
ncbi:hypothetical protein CEE35_06445 [Candidatus Aerophobetes bacterium Ae_b3b]|nr:MAG: hypothetical protein CEE35_06445 [Candidatus Aerophobetes bacterium Ae_b3b]